MLNPAEPDDRRRITLVLGGARSGKSAYAEAIVTATSPPWVYCATARALDSEMTERIAHHRARRASGWDTVDVPLDVAPLLATERRPVLVDCLTLWLTNVMLADKHVPTEVEGLIEATMAARTSITFVSNEVGLGIVPENAMARAFRDHAGRLHQDIAKIAHHVVFMAAGLPMVLKDDKSSPITR